jgi:hypothetical protein
MEGEEVVEGEVEGTAEVERMDRSFHSVRAGRLNFSELDPSLSLCFLCHTEQDFDNLCIGEERTPNPVIRISVRILSLFIHGRIRIVSYRLLQSLFGFGLHKLKVPSGQIGSE